MAGLQRPLIFAKGGFMRKLITLQQVTVLNRQLSAYGTYVGIAQTMPVHNAFRRYIRKHGKAPYVPIYLGTSKAALTRYINTIA